MMSLQDRADSIYEDLKSIGPRGVATPNNNDFRSIRHRR
jgi:hypothetical protein